MGSRVCKRERERERERDEENKGRMKSKDELNSVKEGERQREMGVRKLRKLSECVRRK